MKHLFIVFALLMSGSAFAYDNGVRCAELVGTPDFWDCISHGAGAGAIITPSNAGEVLAALQMEQSARFTLSSSGSCHELVNQPSEFWECIRQNGP